MADSYMKKEREKKRRKKKKDKQEKKEQRKLDGNTTEEFMYVDKDGNLTPTPPASVKSEIKLEDIAISVPKKEETEPLSKVRPGKVKFFNPEKGYGFIIDTETNESYFVHINDLEQEITTDNIVTFEIGSGPKGPIAMKVRKV